MNCQQTLDMNKSILGWMLIAGLFFTSISFATDTQVIKLSSDRKQFQVIFPANPSTGYQWSILFYDKGKLNLITSQYMPPSKQEAIGAAGKMVYNFEVLESDVYPISTTIQFRYARSWDVTNSIRKDVVINVKKAQQKPSIKIQ
ncbi:MAG: protease inhibitor I42 family protein [Legionellaceae bacterium]|nr:protease inhibitor I42 family protein [Legionellaceae bacterium]